MRILIFGIHYYPDLTGIGKYTGEMSAWLASQGHDVHVVTAKPFYPQWKVEPRYKNKWWINETIENVTVTRCPLYVPNDPVASKKIIHEFSFLASIFPVWVKLLFEKKFDVVMGINPPFHLSVYPLAYKYLKGAKMISHVQDLQVDVVNDLGMIKNQTLLKVMFRLEKYFFRKSDLVTTISKGMERKIKGKGIKLRKQFLFPNWVDVGFIRPLPEFQSLRKRFGLKETDKVVMYSGNLGEKQGLEIIIDAAKRFLSQREIKFIIVGNGGAKSRLVDLVSVENLDNILFFPLQPYEDLPSLLATPDIHLVLQKKEASDLVMPSKLTGILASGGCAIVTALPETTLFDVIDEHDMGILVNPENLEEFVAKIDFALTNDTSSIRYNARRYAESYLSKPSILDRFEQKLNQLIAFESEVVTESR
ncbi:WcaI family glycosyltransferase [Lunatibacter salilacus]|uniref:WcaI family glycosyltransferase n=1 Tax=Lunatibacter salilacus TaxID=2483804 RepID=UPI00131C93E8|nr:WcaI family glycosyltransferase [Lunatibacter salilacus]